MDDDIKQIPISKLILNTSNPRFADLYTGTSEDDIIKYLLSEENASEIANNILKHKEYFQDEILWVVKQKNGSFLVKEGNRRTAAVKALNNPKKFGFQNVGFTIRTLPAIIFSDNNKLEERIREKHATPSFRAWSRIAKALEIHRLYISRASEAAMEAIDSKTSDFLKIAHFYYAAVKIKGDEFKELVRSGGEKGNKLTIFERLFACNNICGYQFKSKRYGYSLDITNKKLFQTYIKLIVNYLQKHPETTYYEVNKQEDKEIFLQKIGLPTISKTKQQLDFDLCASNSKKPANSNKKDNSEQLPDTPTITTPMKSSVRGSVKKQPTLKRKGRFKQLDEKIDELFLRLKSDVTPNARMAMVRIVFECSLKWVLEETKYNGKKLLNYDYFQAALITSKGEPRPYTNFTKLSKLFSTLVKNAPIKKALEAFNPDDIHQVIHNYNVSSMSKDCDTMVNNLLPLVEFLLQDEKDFISQINTSKLV